ncbi:MAG: glycoside hydrolase family 125 protein [Chloroflexi bacterium]|nr:glycoside hydrolase family 125 protein [Chloroflexota bacterium]
MDIFQHQLEWGHPYKPLDFGNGLLAGSVSPDGRLLSLNSFHPVQGYVTLSAMPPFPNDRRYDQAAVRAYRAALASRDALTFGLRPAAIEQAPPSSLFLLAGAIPRSRWSDGGLEVEVTTWAPHLDGRPVPGALQQWSWHNTGRRPLTWEYRWEGPLALSRASYTQLTEKGDLLLPALALGLDYDGQTLTLVAPEVGVAAAILGLPAGSPWQLQGNGPLPVATQGRLRIEPGQTVTQTFIYTLAQTVEEAQATAGQLAAGDVQANLEAALEARQRRWLALAERLPRPAPALALAQRAQSYLWDCCAVPVGEGVCLLTDHQLLPLSWTRDAYFLIQGCTAGDGAELGLRRRHLLWLFETAQRPAGYWGRAYLANGRPKDHVFQLDQQCYPLLELAEYAGRCPDDRATLRRLLPHAPLVIEHILSRQAAVAPLFATEETPADDPLPFPYHFSSHVLLWHTLRQLSRLNSRWPFTGLDLLALSQEIEAAAWRYFVANGEGHSLFAYATDAGGRHYLYHDANDLPLVLAPLWGFCPADHPVWQATIAFAFSPANKGGYYDGPLGGLGSVHTPGAWPLGDVQELIAARLLGDTARAVRALERLVATACRDGALPEARDPHNGAVHSRHWFAWPGAALLAALTHPAWQPAGGSEKSV